MTMPDGLMTVLYEVWPLAADDKDVWLLSGPDAWRAPQPLTADTTVHWEVELDLARRDLSRRVGMPRQRPTPPWQEPPPKDGRLLLLHSTCWRQTGTSVTQVFVAVLSCSGPVQRVWRQAVPVGLGLAQLVGPTPPPNDYPERWEVLFHALRHLRHERDSNVNTGEALDANWRRHLEDLTPVIAGMHLHGGEQ